MGGQVPLGYDACGRTLTINDPEAETIRTLYDLYLRHGAVRAVRAEADRLGLRSRQRRSASGRLTGGIALDRGHIHHILTNPLYAGRTRHKDKVHDGQQPAIVTPEAWDAVQAQLQSEASRPRGRRTDRATSASPLVGKVFDETGDRLTPTHTKTRSGKRLRYYVSHRLVRRSGEQGLDGWRLPAAELEGAVANLVDEHMRLPAIRSCFLGVDGTEARITDPVLQDGVFQAEPEPPRVGRLLTLVERVDLAPGQIRIDLDCDEIAPLLGNGDLPPGALAIEAPFQLRKRGVETKLVFAAAGARSVDRTLLLNIAKAHAWFAMLVDGRTYAEIAAAEGTSKRRVQQMLDLAFLAPDLVRMIVDGRQPLGFTSDWALRHDLPADWTAQRAFIATL